MVGRGVRRWTVVVGEVDRLLRWTFKGGYGRLLAQFSCEPQEGPAKESSEFVTNGVFAQHAADDSLEEIALDETNASVES